MTVSGGWVRVRVPDSMILWDERVLDLRNDMMGYGTLDSVVSS